MDRRLQEIKTALLIHFTESPAFRDVDRVVVQSRGLELHFFVVKQTDSVVGMVVGEPTESQIAKMARANDLLRGKVAEALRHDWPEVAKRLDESEERHPWRRKFRTHDRTYQSGSDCSSAS